MYDVQDLCSNRSSSQQTCVLEHAGYTAPTPQHELVHTDQEHVCPEKSSSTNLNRHGKPKRTQDVGIDDLSVKRSEMILEKTSQKLLSYYYT